MMVAIDASLDAAALVTVRARHGTNAVRNWVAFDAVLVCVGVRNKQGTPEVPIRARAPTFSTASTRRTCLAMHRRTCTAVIDDRPWVGRITNIDGEANAAPAV
jgi:hypothetical protein